VLTTFDLLFLWEKGLEQLPVECAVDVLERALPGGRDAMELLPIGRRDRLLLEVRERTFGSRMNAVTECMVCAARIEMQFDANEVKAAEATVDGAIELKCGEYRMRLRVPDSRDVMAASAMPGETGVAELFDRCVVEAWRGGTVVSARELPLEVADMAVAKIAEADPQADIKLAVDCPECGARNRMPLDIGTYLWREIEMFSMRLLREVDALARAYGWDERRILEMSSVRRRCYLEMVRA
jgi:hypothetical protein